MLFIFCPGHLLFTAFKLGLSFSDMDLTLQNSALIASMVGRIDSWLLLNATVHTFCYVTLSLLTHYRPHPSQGMASIFLYWTQTYFSKMLSPSIFIWCSSAGPYYNANSYLIRFVVTLKSHVPCHTLWVPKQLVHKRFCQGDPPRCLHNK